MKFVIKIFICLLFVQLLFANGFSQQKKIYIGLDDHTDYMWSGDEEEYRKAFTETLDYYIRLNDSTANLPYNQQNKWNCDGSYWVYVYKQNRSKEQFDKLITQIKNGKITVPLNTVVSLFGAVPAEATLRNMYYAGALKRKYGLHMQLVLNMEDQVLPLGLSSLWAGAGAKYSWRGVCACATKVTGLERNRPQMFWYKGLDDQKILMKWYSVNPQFTTMAKRKEYRYLFGTYLEASSPENAVIDCKDLLNEAKMYPYNIAAAFGKGGDDLKTLTSNFITVAKNKSDSNYEVIVSNEVDFFKDFEKQYGASLPGETISYGSTEWGNSYASLAEVSASVKRSVEKLRSAEAMYTMIALKDKKYATDLAELKEKAWIACGLYFEHNWTADGPHVTRKQRADWQKKIALQLNRYVDTLYNRSVKKLGLLLPKSPNNIESFYVFNPLSWSRNDYSDYLYNGTDAITIVDKAANKEVPFQIINKKNTSYLRIFATDIPSFGYKIFEIKKQVAVTRFTNTISVTDSTMENQFYKIKINTKGAITSLIDKQHNRECVRKQSNLYLNDLGKVDTNEGDMVTTENKGAVSATLSAFSYRPIKHTSKITLFANSDRIEMENYITQNLDEKPVTYSFSLNLDKPDTWHEEAGAILHAKSITKGGHYADTACRLDWLAMNHFTDMSDADNGMIISNRDAYFMKPGKSTVNRLDDTTAQINVLAAGQIDASLGIINQDGDVYFENFLAIKPHAGRFDAGVAMRFSLQHQNPLIAQKITGGNGYEGNSFSLLTVSDPDVVVWALKPAEEGIGNGIIVRVWNVANTDKAITISAMAPIAKAFGITHIETDDSEIQVRDGKLATTIGHNRMQTFRLFLKPVNKKG